MTDQLKETLTSELAGKRALILLDNAEHLLPGAAAEVAWLVATNGPTLLVTSRERLQLQGEQVYPVPALAEQDGIDLFLARARSLEPAFETNDLAQPNVVNLIRAKVSRCKSLKRLSIECFSLRQSPRAPLPC